MYREDATHTDSSSDESPPHSPASSTSSLGDGHAIPSRLGNFRLLTEFQLEVAPFTKVVKWQSEKSGLKVVWADTPGPICHFWTTVVTEVFSSNGTPHTKEHLTWSPSKNYPYSGFLDVAANRMLAAGTNAWTAVDNTTYTVNSACEEGMLQLIPVFLDHILFPSMTPELFTTEIYHVDGKGEEGGVVFSEMQGREGSQGDVLDQTLRKIVYNKDNAYRSETGGTLEALRKLTLQDILDHHKAMYVPQNMTIFVSGHGVRPERLLATLQATVEKSISAAGLAKGPHPPGWIRPFVESRTANNPPSFARDFVKRVEYADSDESVGTIEISWVGPRPHDWLTCAALSALWDYLCEGDSSPIARKFVNVPQPLCAGVGTSYAFRDPTLWTAYLSSVPSQHLDTLAHDFLDFLKQLRFRRMDMDRMRYKLHQQRLGILATLEDAPADALFDAVLQDAIYGAEDGSTLRDTVNDLRLLDKLERFSERDWLTLFDDWIVERHTVIIIARASAALAKQQTADTQSRIAANRARLGPSGLAQAQTVLAAPKRANERPAPPRVIESLVIPDLRKVEWLEIDTARSNGVARGRQMFSGPLQRKINAEGVEVPYFIQFDHRPSAFVDVEVYIHGPPHELLPLHVSLLFGMPVVRADGSKLTYERMNRELDEFAQGFGATVLGEGICLSMTVVKKRYEGAIAWLSDILHGTDFDDIDRLSAIINGSLQMLPEQKEDGATIAGGAVLDVALSKDSYVYLNSLITCAQTLPAARAKLLRDPNGLIEDFKKIHSRMLDPRYMRMHVSGDVMSLKKPSSAWLSHYKRVKPFPSNELARLLRTREMLTSLGRKPARKAIVYTIPSSQSSYLQLATSCPEWTDHEEVALIIACECLSAANSFLWNAVRGPGLAYGCGVGIDVEGGLLTFSVFKSPDACMALLAAKTVVSAIASGKTPITATDVDQARSNIAYQKVSSLDSFGAVTNQSFRGTVILGRPLGYPKMQLKRMQDLTPADILGVIKKWVLPVFDSSTSILGASTTEEQRGEFVKQVSRLGWQVEERRF